MILEMNKVQYVKWSMKQSMLTSEISCPTDSCQSIGVIIQRFEFNHLRSSAKYTIVSSESASPNTYGDCAQTKAQ